MFFLPSNATIPEPGNGTSQKTNPLGAVKQIIFVRHGEHAYLNDTDTPCMSDIGMARAVMFPRYLTRPDAPRGVVSFFLSAFLFGFFFLGKEKNSKTQKLKNPKTQTNLSHQLSPTLVYAMDGDTKEDDPRTVRPINSAIPYVISKRIAPERFIRKFGQRTPADVAASMLSEGGGQVILNVWLHWEVPAMLCWMGVPITGWNSVSLDEETQATYKVREERERVGRRNEKMREAGLSPPGYGMLLMLEAAAELLVGGEEEGRREREGKKERRREAERERERRGFFIFLLFFSLLPLSFLFPPLSPPPPFSLSLSPLLNSLQ